MTVNWHREFAVNFATFLKVCRDFSTFAPWFSYSPTQRTQSTLVYSIGVTHDSAVTHIRCVEIFSDDRLVANFTLSAPVKEF